MTTLDPFWDTPKYTSESLNRLKTERANIKLQMDVTLDKAQKIWDEEQLLRQKINQLIEQRQQLAKHNGILKKDYEKLSTIEIDFAEQVRKQNELDAINNKISALELKLKEYANGRTFWEALMPYQREDLLYALNAYDMGFTGVMNANDMGLGKTFETIAFDFLACKMFQEKHGQTPTRIWVTKLSLTGATCREIKKWFGDANIIPLVGGTPEMRKVIVDYAKTNNAMLVCNYEALTTTPSILGNHWNFIYMDEVHRLKGGANYKPTLLWKSARDLVFSSRAKGNSFFMPLSGSPIQNTPKDMWAYLHLFDPTRFDSVNAFERRYCSFTGKGIQINPELLIKAMKAQIIRRTMREVKEQLSTVLKDPIFDIREVEMPDNQRRIYNQMRNEFFVWLDQEETEVLTASVVIAQLNRLRQIAIWPDAILSQPVGSAKIDETMDIIDELVNADEQVVIFSSQYNDPLEEINRRCTEYLGIPSAIIKGGIKNVDELCEDFRQGRIKVLCINAKSGGEGLNLQKSDSWPGGSSHVVMLDLWWNPKANEQAIARVYRTGQTDVVTVHVIKALDSVDLYIDRILEDKTMMINSVMEVKELRKDKAGWKNALKDVI